MGNKWKWQWSGSQLSLLLLPSSQMPVSEDGSIHGVTPVRALLTHPVYLPLYCSLPLSYTDPKRPPYSLSHCCSITLSPSYHISSLVLFPYFSCTVPHSTVGLSFPSLLYFFRPLPPSFRSLLPAIPCLSFLCFHSLHLLFSFTNASAVSSHSYFPSPKLFLFSFCYFSITFIL